MLERSIPIVNAAKIQTEAKRIHNVELSLPKVRGILKTELGLGYRMAKKVPVQCNSERCLVLRQQERQRIGLNLTDIWLEPQANTTTPCPN